MADWTGTARSNYFRVKDPEAFKAAMERYEVRVLERRHPGSDEMYYGLVSETESGGWPFYDYETEEDISLWMIVSEHLAFSDVAVFVEAGSERSRYVTGYAVAFDATGRNVRVDLDDIYTKAKEAFGHYPNAAEY